MNQTIKPLGVRDFMAKYQQDETLFDDLPEFSFIKPVAFKAKEKRCTCGLGQEINNAIMLYNDFVQEVNPDLVRRVKEKFGLDQGCFVVQTSEAYEVKCYN